MKSGGHDANIHVVSRKFDGSGQKMWPARILKQEANLLILEASFADDIQHTHLGLIKRGTVSLEFYWLDRWYNVFCFLDNTGDVSNYYCNISLPPQFTDGILSYTDLDLDVTVTPSGVWQILDEDEFEANSRRFNYSPNLRQTTSEALQSLLTTIQSRSFPFDGLLPGQFGKPISNIL